jgi:hypothetical protein
MVGESFEDCLFYHTIDLPGHGLIYGPWDLRGREDQYTGHVDFDGKSVMEIGPASGGLTAYIEQRGGKVTCVETSDELGVDILPIHGADIASHIEGGRSTLKQVCAAWNYTQATLGLTATCHYGDVNTLPSKIGTFDISFVGAILLHCKSPFDVVHQACEASSGAVIVTDLVYADMVSTTEALMRFDPSNGTSVIAWWGVSPGAIISMLRLHGFSDCTATFHEQKYGVDKYGIDPIFAKMFTVVGRR